MPYIILMVNVFELRFQKLFDRRALVRNKMARVKIHNVDMMGKIAMIILISMGFG